MKQLLVVALMFSGFQLRAQSMLYVTTTNHIMINVAVDKRYYNKHNKALTVGNLPPGKHWLQVFAYSGENPHRRFRNLVYEGRVKTHEGEVTSCVIDANTGNIDVSHTPFNPNNSYRNDDVYGGESYNPMYADTTAISNTADVNVISDNELNKLGKSIADKLTDTDKMRKMKAELNGKSVSTTQVSTMMSWLNFETTRLDFVEWIYPNVADKEHYKELENKFNFGSTKQKLESFLNDKK